MTPQDITVNVPWGVFIYIYIIMENTMNIQTLERDLLAHPDLSGLSAEKQFELLKESAKHMIGEDRLLAALRVCKKNGRPLRVKYGIDATGQEMHLGHAVPLFVLRRLQKMGHHVVLLIGDFTARVGDPTGRVTTRPVLSEEEIRDNASRYTAQAGRVLDIARTEVRFNSEWLETYKLSELFRILGGLTVATAMQREDFRKRESVTRAELLYSTLMGIDSVVLESELELGGDDQLLNFYDAERIMINEGLCPESALTTDILLGTTGDGTKMSKSLGNFISVVADPPDMYGKIMSIPDRQLELYFKLLTDMRTAQWEVLSQAMDSHDVEPREIKRMLARVVVADLNGVEAASAAQNHFDRVVVKKQAPSDLRLITIERGQVASWVSLLRLFGLSQIKSNSDAHRLLTGNGVHIVGTNGEKTVQFSDPLPLLDEEITVRIGKRTFVRFMIH